MPDSEEQSTQDAPDSTPEKPTHASESEPNDGSTSQPSAPDAAPAESAPPEADRSPPSNERDGNDASARAAIDAEASDAGGDVSDPPAAVGASESADRGRSRKKKKRARQAESPKENGTSASTSADEAKPRNAPPAAEPASEPNADAGESESAPAPWFKPARTRLRDWILFAAPVAVLAWIMSYRGDVMNPRGDDPAHRLSHYASLWHSGHVPGGVIIGILCAVVAVIGALGLLGDSPLDLRGDEVLPISRDTNEHVPWYRKEGTWLVGFCVLLYVPFAGAYGLWDPWETHYSEVAREILARDDWITLWWGQEGWFMSKPILIFWLAALGMGVGSAFGLPFWRDMGPGSHEWFIRLPIIFFAIGAVYAVYRAVRAAWGPRAGLISGLVLATMPHWFFLSHQAMTDMPFVAPLVIAMSCLILAIITNPEKLATARTIRIFNRSFRISAWHLGVGAIILVALPQVLYLLTRPVMLACPDGANPTCQQVLESSRIGRIQLPIERYWSGSAANSVLNDRAASMPGSPAWEDRYNQVAGLTSLVQGIFWLVAGTLLLRTFRRERRLQPIFFWVMYLFSAISFMGKGPAGLGVPEIVLLGFMIVTNRWSLLTQFRFFQGIGIFLLCGFPWYLAIYCRLGNEFFDRFVVHDLLNRAFAGVHGDTGTFRYFVWQLGYATFPWVGFVPAALLGWKLYVPPHATRQQKDVVRVALLWVAVTFTLFSLMVTKFHHYIFPMVPGTALLVGLLLHRMLGDRRWRPSRQMLAATVALAAGTGSLVIGLANFFGAWHGQVSREAPFRLPHGSPMLAAMLTIVAVVLLIFAWRLSTRAERQVEGAGDFAVEPSLDATRREMSGASFAAVGIAATILIALVGRDLGLVGSSRPAGFERLMHLFTYNYERPFPTRSYDYHAILTGFALVAVLGAVMIVGTRTRRNGVRTLIALATCFAIWALDKYMIDLSNHWSQRNLFVRYYQVRNLREQAGFGEDARYWADPIAAYQMNWKGENFYTGNHAAMLECGLPLCQERTPEWLRRHQGQRLFFVTEHTRASSVIGQVRQAGGSARTITDEYDNNKFVLVEANP